MNKEIIFEGMDDSMLGFRLRIYKLDNEFGITFTDTNTKKVLYKDTCNELGRMSYKLRKIRNTYNNMYILYNGINKLIKLQDLLGVATSFINNNKGNNSYSVRCVTSEIRCKDARTKVCMKEATRTRSGNRK